ncbi:MAG: hypothetical protein ACOC9P_01250 [bacterium]
MSHEHHQSQLRQALRHAIPSGLDVTNATASEDERCAIALDRQRQHLVVYDGTTGRCHIYPAQAIRHVEYLEDGHPTRIGGEPPPVVGDIGGAPPARKVKTVELRISFHGRDQPQASVCFLTSGIELRKSHPWYQEASRMAVAWKTRLEAARNAISSQEEEHEPDD